MGAMHLARPLFAASFGVPVFLVAFLFSSNAVARLISGVITGFLMDRWGRRPLLIAGVVVRFGSALGEYFATSYLEFLIWEFIGGLGISVWTTGSSVLIADVTDKENRGRAVAVRTMSVRLGNIAGPFIGALLTTVFTLRSIFLFNALTKFTVLVIVFFLIKETRPEFSEPQSAEPRTGHQKPATDKFDFSVFLTRGVLVISLATFGMGLMVQGVFAALFPIYVQQVADFNASDVGYMITIASITTLLISYPNGVLVDRYGRKKTLIPGLFILGLSSYLLAQSVGYSAIVVMVIIYGIGMGMTMGTTQVYAMDLAPERRRGAFLGVWSILTHSSSVLAPLLLGFLAGTAGLAVTFYIVSILLSLCAVLTWAYGPETGRGKGRV